MSIKVFCNKEGPGDLNNLEGLTYVDYDPRRSAMYPNAFLVDLPREGLEEVLKARGFKEFRIIEPGTDFDKELDDLFPFNHPEWLKPMKFG
jgi:hypothetical protein